MGRLRGILAVALMACGREHFEDASNSDGIAHDEDGDGINDPADNCAAAFNELQEDRDSDGIGDACDPHPDTAGDVLLATGFFTDSFGDWVPNTVDAWTFANGSLDPSAADPDTIAATLALSAEVTQPTLQLVFAVTDYGVVAGVHSVSITIALPNRISTCTVTAGNGGNFDQISVVADGSGASGPIPGTVASGMPTRVQFTRNLTDGTCTAGSGNTRRDGVNTISRDTATFTIDVRAARIGITNAVLYDVP